MSDQTISGSPGSKQQSAGEAQGHCEETEFLHLHVSPQEKGDEEILLRGGERRAADQAATTKPLQAAVEQQLRGTGWETWAWALLLWWELYPEPPGCLQTLGCPPVLGYSVRCNMYVDAHFFFEHFRSSCIFLCPQLSWSRGAVGEDDNLFGDGGMNNCFLQSDRLLPISVSNYQVIAANERICFIHLML